MNQSPINRDRTQETDSRYQRARKDRMDAWQASLDRAEKRRLERLRAQQEAALQAQKDAALAARDKRQQEYGAQNANRQANNALGAANADFQYQMRLNNQERRTIRDRDKRLNQFDTQQLQMKNRDLRERDKRQFDYTTAENDQKFDQQLERDYRQQGYSMERDRLQGDQTLQRDMLQGGIQADRDERLNAFDVDRQILQHGQTMERDTLQNDFQSERDARLNIFDTQRDMRRQQFEQTNIYRQQADEIAAKWQERVAIAKQNGYEYSPAQRQEMKQIEDAFMKNVINGDLPDDMKERANIEHQRQMSRFLPEQKVSTPEQEISQQFYEDPKLGLLQRTLDRNGNPVWQRVDSGMGDQASMMRQQAQDQQKQAEAMSRKQHERLAAFQSVYDQVETILDENDRPKFNTPEKVMAEAMRRFAPREKAYQADGLPPLGQFLNPDEVPQPQGQQQPQQQPGNPWRAAMEQRQNGQYAPPNDGFSVVPGKGQMSPATPGERQASKPPVILSTKPLGNEVVQRLERFPNGGELAKIREKHKSNSADDQIMRGAADIVIDAMITNDRSNPYLEEALQMLHDAGITIELGK